MSRTYRIVVPLLGIWLLGWIFLSWPAIQDDALIHLRYADNLWLHHFITYDGVNPNYGASSLLYVGILAILRSVSSSPNLARATSSVVHVLVFGGLALAFGLWLPRSAKLARMAGLVLLVLVAMPSAVRWLDDGMETGIVVVFVAALAWLIHGQAAGENRRYVGLLVLSFLAVLLRTELVLMCAGGFTILIASSLAGERLSLGRAATAGLRRSHLVFGATLALVLIFAMMHVLLPDTALAKSHGIRHWFNPIHDTAITLGGAFSFGIGMLLFWLLTLVLVVLRAGRLTLRNAVANCFCPVVLALSALRGQEIQGVRYFAWTFFFSIVWNVLELARPENDSARFVWYGRAALYIFLAVLAVDLPFESVAMYRVLMHRGATMHSFESQGLELLRTRRGIASDIGYIGYFTKAEICDLAGLVNGHAAAKLGSFERAETCMRTNPDFIFVNASQLVPLTKMADLSQWKVCGQYEFANVTAADMHYLIVRPELTADACLATARLPVSIQSVLAPGR